MKKKKQAAAPKKTPQKAKTPGLMDIFQEMTKAAVTNEGNKSEVDAYFLENQKEAKKLSYIDESEKIQADMARESFSSFRKPAHIKPKETRFDMMYDEAENELNLKNENLHKFRELMCHPDSLRDYILMKEILDKPKALQEL